MNQFLTVIPSSPIAWLVTIIVAVAAVFYIFSKVRENDMTVLRNANVDLRDTLSDNEKRVTAMELEIKTLMVKVDALEKRNKTLEDLVITALKQYFFENPKVASTLKDIISSQA